MIKVTRIFAPVLALFAASCISTSFDAPPRAVSFAESVSQFDVVPPSWITADGRSIGIRLPPESSSIAFVFPSLPVVGAARSPIHVDIPGFFRPNAWFTDGTFVQLPATEAEQAIEIRTARSDINLVVDIDAASMAQIHRLDWSRFQSLQAAYLTWLYAQSSCWSIECFSNEATLNLRAFWGGHVLQEATFGRFAANYLNTNRPVGIKYTGADPGISTAGLSPMYASLVEPNQLLAITWGNQNLYPERAGGGDSVGLETSYSRVTPGGTTRIQVVSDHGMRLFPSGTCTMATDAEKDPPLQNAGELLLPYHKEWRPLISTLFFPIYNLFDLRAPILLRDKGAAKDQAGCRGGAPPQHLFLLSPSSYLKPDLGETESSTAQFEHEARVSSIPVTASRDELKTLTRQFILVACQSSSVADLKREWNRFLETAHKQLAPNTRVSGPTRCGNFVHGVFAGKTFVELKNHYSINGQQIEDSALNLQTIGQVLTPSLGVRANIESLLNSSPLVTVWRVSKHDQMRGQRMQLRFYTTMNTVLNQGAVLEGDEIHAITISEALR